MGYVNASFDFIIPYLAIGKPYKLVYVKLGNIPMKELIAYFNRNSETIVQLLEHHSYIILEKTRIRILD